MRDRTEDTLGRLFDEAAGAGAQERRANADGALVFRFDDRTVAEALHIDRAEA